MPDATPARLDDIPMIETTVHLYDPNRPQGAPYAPDKEGVSAAKYRAHAAPGVVGAVACECSPWIEDNLWLLEACAKDPIMVGCTGNLRPQEKAFPQFVERYHKNPMYLGIRHGNLWGYDLPKQLADPAFVDGLKVLGQAGLVLDLANPNLELLQAAVRVNDRVPELKIIVDHLAGFYPTPQEQGPVEAVLREYAGRPMIYGKLTAFGLGLPNNPPPLTLAANGERLEMFYHAFGEDRVIGGTWSEKTIPLYREFMAPKGRAAAEKFFWRNSAKVYRWTPRAPNQPRLG
jgi:predicted TIM-barrel fold metal-dependent hydrolase